MRLACREYLRTNHLAEITWLRSTWCQFRSTQKAHSRHLGATRSQAPRDIWRHPGDIQETTGRNPRDARETPEAPTCPARVWKPRRPHALQGSGDPCRPHGLQVSGDPSAAQTWYPVPGSDFERKIQSPSTLPVLEGHTLENLEMTISSCCYLQQIFKTDENNAWYAQRIRDP